MGMNDQQRAAMQMALDLLELDEKYPRRIRGSYPKEVITALREALAQPQCNQHPDAPHGFDRNASHSADRYVCECESWEQPQGDPVEPVAWINEDELPESYPYDLMYPYSKVDVVRMFPVFAPNITPPSVEAAKDKK